MFKTAITIFFLLFSVASFSQDWRQQGYESVASSVASRVDAKRITISQANMEMADAVRKYFPDDHLTMSTWDRLAAQALRMERGEITREEYDAIVSQAWRQLEADKANMLAQQREEQDRQRRAAIVGGALRGAAAGASNISRQSGVSCSSHRFGDTVQTTCN